MSSFHETNVRTYVHRDGRDPGVWFFSLDAANRLAVWIARTFWHLPYHHARMTLQVGETVRYESHRRSDGATFRGEARPIGEPHSADPGTLEHFLAERYLLYAQRPAGTLCRGQVHHAPYPLQPAELTGLDESLLAAAGARCSPSHGEVNRRDTSRGATCGHAWPRAAGGRGSRR